MYETVTSFLRTVTSNRKQFCFIDSNAESIILAQQPIAKQQFQIL